MENTPEQVCERFMALFSRFKAYWGVAAEDQGLTIAQLYALYMVDKRGEIAMGQAAKALHCDASNVTGIVDRLVAQGLLVREENKTDRRAKVLRPTSTGKKLIDAVTAELPTELGCTKLTANERADLAAILAKMNT